MMYRKEVIINIKYLGSLHFRENKIAKWMDTGLVPCVYMHGMHAWCIHKGGKH